jgi:outer membrane protein assembly factor BamB
MKKYNLKKGVIPTFFLLAVFLLSGKLTAQSGLSPYEKNWPQWRGPHMTGAAMYGNPPVEWSETRNIKWKTEIPGKGHATPIIWNDQIIVLTAVETDKKADGNVSEPASQRPGPPSSQTDKVHKFQVVSVNRLNGKIQWATTVKEEVPKERTHNLGSWASGSPVTDGEFIYAYFGSRGLFCLDFKGNIKWERDFGQLEMVMSFGEGTSAALYGDRLFVQWDHEGNDFLYAVDKKTGKDVWTAERNEVSSWATPLVVEVNGKPQVITSATNKVKAYDYETGGVIWECTGMTRNVIPNPVYENGILYLMSGFRGSSLKAVDPTKAKGDITGSPAILWEYNQNTPYTPSPMILKDKLYFLKLNNGELTCLDARDGKVNYSNSKLEGTGAIYSSPTGVNEQIYIMGGTGTCVVVKAGSEFKVLATNILEDSFHASPVVIGNDLYLRGFKNLYCISEGK